MVLNGKLKSHSVDNFNQRISRDRLLGDNQDGKEAGKNLHNVVIT